MLVLRSSMTFPQGDTPPSVIVVVSRLLLINHLELIMHKLFISVDNPCGCCLKQCLLPSFTMFYIPWKAVKPLSPTENAHIKGKLKHPINSPASCQEGFPPSER